MTLLGLTTVLLTVSACQPFLLSDKGNAFLKGFVNQELLSFLGVIVSITLASAGNIHLELNKLQDQTGSPFLSTRRAIKLSAFSLIGFLAAASGLVVIKPLFGDDINATAACNSIAISLVVFSIFVLIDLTRTTLGIPAASTLPAKADPQ